MEAKKANSFRDFMLSAIFVLALFLNVLNALAEAIDDKVEVPFLFSEDEKLPQSDFRKTIPQSSALSNNQYLNAPMTRMEYMLTRLEAQLNENNSVILWKLNTGFEPDQTSKMPPSIEGTAIFNQETGRIVVGYRIDYLGQPRKPMRTTCDEILSGLQFIAPQELLGFTYHNTVLGVLSQKDPSEYSPILEIFAKNIVHRVTLIASTKDENAVHCLTCLRPEKDAPVLYYRYSFKLRSEEAGKDLLKKYKKNPPKLVK